MKEPQLTFRRCSDNSQSSPEQRQSIRRPQEPDRYVLGLFEERLNKVKLVPDTHIGAFWH